MNSTSNSAEVVKNALSKGHLVSRDAIEILSEDLSLIDGIESVVINKRDLIQEKREPNFSIKYEASPETETGVDDIVSLLNNRLNTMKPILESKIDKSHLSSAMSLGAVGKQVSVIGLIREPTENGFTIDDGSESVMVSFEGKVIEDTVIGIEGKVTPFGIQAEKIVYPDIEMKDSIKGDGRILITNDINSDNLSSFTHVISTSGVGAENVPDDVDVISFGGESDKENVYNLNVPAEINIGGVDILLFRNESLSADNAVPLIRSRHMNPALITKDDHLLLTKVPDIMVCLSDSDVFANYKGVTLISPKDSSFTIELSSGEIKET